MSVNHVALQNDSARREVTHSRDRPRTQDKSSWVPVRGGRGPEQRCWRAGAGLARLKPLAENAGSARGLSVD
eukprot:4529549-Heterocapsa_arctica.AAC.1